MSSDFTTSPTRRRILAGAAASAAMAAAFSSARAVAATARIPFGSAVMISDFRSDAALRAALAAQCDVITPMNELKWDWVRRNRETYDFDHAEEIIAFARKNGKAVHGHPLVWGLFVPRWVEGLSSAREAERELRTHVETMAARFAGRIGSWDVVNEVIAHEPKPDAPMRDTPWQRLLGEAHVDIAFRTAAAVDPKARLVLNDYDFENADERTAERRRQALRLVRRLQDKKIAVHEVGFQAHLYGEKPIDPRAITAFCRELGRLGVGVRITELDVIDWKLPGKIAERDRIAADLVSSFLGAVIEGQRPSAIITWGMSDKSSWVHETFKRNDRFRGRPLPLDENYQPKPMMAAIQAARMLPGPPAPAFPPNAPPGTRG